MDFRGLLRSLWCGIYVKNDLLDVYPRVFQKVHFKDLWHRINPSNTPKSTHSSPQINVTKQMRSSLSGRGLEYV